MKLFELRDWNVIISEQAYMLTPFKKIVDNDKSKDKTQATRELAFLWFYVDIKSDYQYLLNDKERASEIAKDLGMPKDWKISKDLQEAIDFYNKHSTTVSSEILKNSMFMANTISMKTKQLVEKDDLTIAEIEKIGKSLAQMPSIVASLQKLEASVLKEISEKADRVGSQDKALFEDGLF